MENRLDSLSQHKPLLACYLPIGDPKLPASLSELYAECGVNIFEIGIASNAPYMDGKIVTDSMTRILQKGVSVEQVGQEIIRIYDTYTDCANVVMGYPGELIDAVCDNYGICIDGRLVVGDTATRHTTIANYYDIKFISHMMSTEELQTLPDAKGYIMLQASPGKTGVRQEFTQENVDKIKLIKSYNSNTPVLLGFGISTPEHARLAISCGADGVVIGSACIHHAMQGEHALTSFLYSVRSALDHAS